MARADSVWIFPWTCSVGEGPCWHYSLRRRALLLGALHQTLARIPPPLSPHRNRSILHDRPALVHPMRPPQPRLLPRLHHRAQLQTLPHPRIPAHPTLLVLHSNPNSSTASVDCHAGCSHLGRLASFENGSVASVFKLAIYLLLSFYRPLLHHLEI